MNNINKTEKNNKPYSAIWIIALQHGQPKKPLTETERGCTNQIPLTIKPYPMKLMYGLFLVYRSPNKEFDLKQLFAYPTYPRIVHLCRPINIQNSRARKQLRMVLQTAKGYPEAVLMGACEVVLFHKTADWFRQKIGITFINKMEDGGSISWQFQFAGVLMMLQYIPTVGISLCPVALTQATDEERGAFKKLIETIQFDQPAVAQSPRT